MDISRCPAFKQLRLVGLNKLKCFRVDYSLLLECFELHDCRELDKIPRILDLGKLVSIDIRDCPKLCSLFIEGCGKLISFQLFKCQNLEQVCIGDCPELEVLSSFERQTSLEKIAINRCVKLKKITLPPDFVEIVIDACRKLKTVAVICDRSEFLKVQELSSVARLNQLKSLSLFNCPELEELSCSTLLSNLKRITIESCDKLRSITLPPELDELVIEGCRELKIVAVVCDRSECLELEELSGLSRPSLLKWITIQSCDKLHIIQGIDELHRLQSLHLSDCPELEELPCSAGQTCLESFSIVRCGNLHNIVLPPNLVELIVEGCRELITVAVICDHNEFLRCLKRITIQSCDKLQTIEGIDEFHALENFLLSNCPEFEELSCSAQLSHLKWITIERCKKLRNITLPKTLVELVIEGCRELKTVGVVCDSSEGLERQELSCVLRILNCHKIQTIDGTNELHGLTVELLYCSSTAIRNCISMFKSVPSEFLVMIGRAVDGALSILNPNFFSDADAVIPAISKIHTNASDGRTLLMSRFSVIIFCYVVVVNGGHLVEMINQSLAKRCWSNYRVEEGEWVITIVIADLHKASLHNRRRQLQDVLVEYGILKQGYKVAVKNGKWSKTRRLLLRIGEKLYHKRSAS